MKNMKSNNNHSTTPSNHIPDIEIIDLEFDGNTEFEKTETNPESLPEAEALSPENDAENTSSEKETESAPSEGPAVPSKRGIRSFLNIHVLLLGMFVIFVVAIIWKFSNWGTYVDISEIESDHSAGYSDVLDHFLPLMDKEGNIVPTGKPENIVVFGNSPFADDRDSEDNLANLIAEATDAKVYNCSVSNSYLASQWPFFDADEKPMDAYCLYWLVTLGVNGANKAYYTNAAEKLGDAIPPDAQEVFDTLTSLDFNTVDTVVIMYDATDYLLGHEMYDDLNSTNITQFTGNLEAGIELLQMTYPHIRIIVLSPTYAYGINENGEYVSGDIQRYGQDVLSTYVIKQGESCFSRSVSFVDNFYGTITEDNADEYLIDNLHLNVEGRKLIVERFMQALSRYSK